MSDRPDRGSQRGPVEGSLSARAVSGGRWAAIDTAMLQLSTTISTLVLARILTPADFGAVAGAMIIVRLFELLTEVGLGSSMVRRSEFDTREASTIFWLAVGLGAIVGAVTAISAQPLSILMGQPGTAPLVMALSSTIPLSLIAGVGTAMLLRDLRFKAASLVGVGSMAFYLVTVIVLAYIGFGPWAIVIGYIVRGFVNAVLPFLLVGWRPTRAFDRSLILNETRFSAGIAGQRALGYLQRNADYWIISAALGATVLGQYYIAFVIPDLLRRRFSAAGSRVFFPLISRVHTDKKRAKGIYLRLVRLVAFASVPAMAGVSALSPVIIELAFGARWEAAVAPMAVLALAGAITALGAQCGALATAVGRPHVAIPARIAGLVVLIAGLALTVPTANLALISWSVVAAALTTTLGLYLTTGPMIDVSLSQQLKALIPVIVPSLVMYGFLLGVRGAVVSAWGTVPAAIALVSAGIAVYAAVSGALFKTSFLEQVGLLRSIFLPTRQPSW